MQPDPSRTSYYVSDALYHALIADFADWQRDERAIADPAIRDQFRMLIEREARLLDQLRYEEWLCRRTLAESATSEAERSEHAARARELRDGFAPLTRPT